MLLIASIYRNIENLFYSIIYAKAIDSIVKIVQEGGQLTDLWPYFVIMVTYYIVGSIFGSMYTYSRRYIMRYGWTEMDLFFMKKIRSLGIQTLENPEVNNLLKRAEDSLYEAYWIIWYLFDLIGSIIRAIAAGIVLLGTLPFFVPALIFIAIIKFLPERYFDQLDFNLYYDNTEKRRRANANKSFLTMPNKLTEVSIINAFNSLLNGFSTFFNWYNKKNENIVKNSELTYFFLNLLDIGVTIAGYVASLTKVIAKEITIGTAMLYVNFLSSFSKALADILMNISSINRYLIRFYDVSEFLHLSSSIPDGTIILKKLDIPPLIEFKDVSFNYPGTDKNVLENFQLSLRPGEKIAIVGHNGAGKTTIAKLISRIYLPTAGHLAIDGTKLSDIKTESWHQNMSVLFQEYNLYDHLTAAENIHIGNSDRDLNMDEIIAASKSADAHDFIMEFPKQYDQVLSEKYEGGIRPSTGQAQKIALARFFYRNAPVVIFDEPTAAIDAVSEYKIFEQIYKFFKNKTVVIISHRFSTVRNADRIIVMEKGQIKEMGSHKELIEMNGIYAHAFKLQAEGYQS